MTNSAKEKAILVAFLIGTILPVRLVMHHFVSENWIGSVGAITAVMIAIIYLSRTQRLGYIGRLFNKKIEGIRTSGAKMLLLNGFALVFTGFGTVALGVEPTDAMIANMELLHEGGPVDKYFLGILTTLMLGFRMTDSILGN